MIDAVQSERAGVMGRGVVSASLASIGAGLVHAAAIGIHAEHLGLSRIFTAIAVVQLVVGVATLVRPRQLMAVALAVANAPILAGWGLTRVTGISWIGGLEVKEAPQFADTSAAALAAAAIVGSVMTLRRSNSPARTPPVKFATPALLVAALAIPAMLSSTHHEHGDGETSHSHDDAVAAGRGSVDAATAHDHSATSVDSASPTANSAASSAVAAGEAASTWPRPWDPSKAIDVSGVAGVTAEQQARAERLIEASLQQLPRYADPAIAVADGYSSIGDAATGSEHFIKASLIDDDVMLDASQPESLVYTVDGDTRTLAGAMYIASDRPTDDPTLLDFAGPLMQWHNHGNLCWAVNGAGKPVVVGLVRDDGTCARGINTGSQNPMVHVWITPHPCGVFAALEGVGAGQASVPDDQRVDMCAATHGHS